MSIWSFFRRLFGGKPRPSPAPALAPAGQDAAPDPPAEETPAWPPQAIEAPAAAPEPFEEAAEAAWAGEEEPGEDEEDEDEEHEEDEEEPDAEPDPFIREPAPVDEIAAADVAILRVQARAEALGGEHKVLVSTPAGPGSLAEALNLLLEEGRLEADYIDDPLEGSFIIYRPVPPQA